MLVIPLKGLDTIGKTVHMPLQRMDAAAMSLFVGSYGVGEQLVEAPLIGECGLDRFHLLTEG